MYLGVAFRVGLLILGSLGYQPRHSAKALPAFLPRDQAGADLLPPVVGEIQPCRGASPFPGGVGRSADLLMPGFAEGFPAPWGGLD